MRPTRPPPAPLGSADETEQQFYEALRQADIERLMRLWADDDDIYCVHPSGGRTLGPAAIRATFEAIFAHGAIDVRPDSVRRVQTHDSAVHSVVEQVQPGTAAAAAGARPAWVLATNVYVKTLRGWRLVAHHASPGGSAERQEAAESPSVLH